MSKQLSPLRYPGGKSCLYPLIAKILYTNRLERTHYAEPFAGGCGLAFPLLIGGHVSDIHINDVDYGIWAFWHSVLEQTDSFLELIEHTPVTVEEWHKQRSVHASSDLKNPLALGFSTFFLNRTNRSGIVKRSGVIGGLDQSGPYKIDCRFNRPDLIRRIRRISKYRNRIHLSRFDACDFIKHVTTRLPNNTFMYIDPPYYDKGSMLYTSFYNSDDHGTLASILLDTPNPWIATYDNVPEVRLLYRKRRQFGFDVKYSLEVKRVATELLIASKGIRLPATLRQRRITYKQIGRLKQTSTSA